MTKKKFPLILKIKIIVGLFTIITGFIGFKSCRVESPDVDSTNNQGTTIIFQGNVGNVEITDMLPQTTTENAIKNLENKLNQTEENIELSKQDIEHIANALRDLNERTAGIQKLPDGRTKFGQFISGKPTIVIKGYSLALSHYKEMNFENAFKYIKNAIKAHEDTKKIGGLVQTGMLKKEFISSMYMLGSIISQDLKKNDIAYDYAKKAISVENSSPNKALLSTALANLNKYDEAIKYIDEAILVEPNKEYYKKLKQLYIKRMPDTNK